MIHHRVEHESWSHDHWDPNCEACQDKLVRLLAEVTETLEQVAEAFVYERR